ncbi:MAG: hypothetical protein NT001_03675, partial [Candidatus Woesearchaeota archaeon]|nr:hypothetical protein [Candidatus Woesearchaeota archaeon]
MKRKSMLRKLKNLFYADNNSYLDAAAQASAKSAETSAFAPEKQISAEPYAIQDKPQDEFKDYNGNPQDNRIPLQLIEQNEEDNKFLRAVGSKIFEISQEMEDLSKSVNSYGSVVQDFRNMIHERTQEVEKMLSSPWVYAQNQIDSTTWRWMIPGFERRSADKITKRGLESKLCSISKMISDMEIPLDDGSRKAESICLQLNNINILLSRYMERRFGSDTFNAPSEESGQKSGHYNTNEFLKTDLQKNEECYRSQFAYQSGRVASLIGRIEPIQLSLCSIREDMDYTIKKERLGLQSLVEKISSKHEISMMNKEYKLSGRKKRPSLIPAAVTAACMAGLMITYNYNDIA